VPAHVSEEHIASIFKVEEISSALWILAELISSALEM
jgi:hypothetical protein